MSAVALTYVYAEELALAGPEAVAERIERLGCDGAALALAYHPARLWLPRHRAVRHCPPGTINFTPRAERYPVGLIPRRTADAATVSAVHAFRAALADRGLAFHAWLVVLHHGPLALARPDRAATTSDGTPTPHALCPAHLDVLRYASALVADVCDQLEPEGVELEAVLPSTWDPAYTITLALDEPDADARAALGACACAACGAGATGVERLAARTVEAVADAARAGGARARVLLFGAPVELSAQGAAPTSLSGADAVGVGVGALTGAEAALRFTALAGFAGDRPVTASVNWAPGRTPDDFAADVGALADVGARGVALYNMSLVPEDGLPALAAAARAARERCAPIGGAA